MANWTAFILAAVLALAPLPAAEPAEKVDSGLDAYIQEEFEKTHFPGMSIAIVNADEVLFSAVYGDCQEVDTPFIIGSQSKSFTAVAVMQLAEQGKLHLDDAAAKYLPQLDSDCPVTLRQLLNQTSGISEYTTVATCEPGQQPAEFVYSNVNYGLLGRVVENVSGMPYAQYIEQNIFEPLGMEDSYTSLAEAKAGGLAPGHRCWFGVMVEQEVPYPEEDSGWLTVPAGYLISSAGDMGRYLQAYLSEGGAILQPDSAAEMMNSTVFVGEGQRYGLGLGVLEQGGQRWVVHGGNVENYTTHMIMVPEKNVALEVMFNGGDYFVSNAMAVQLADNIMNRVLGQPAQSLSPTTYRSTHLLVNAIMLAVLALCALPLVMIRRWKKKNKERPLAKQRRGTQWVIFGVLHLLLPVCLLLLPWFLGLPVFVVRDFAPDVFAVMVAGAALLFAAGALKAHFYWRNWRRKEEAGAA